MEKVSVNISPNTFEKLKQIAIPLVDDIDSVINRLINHWNANTHESSGLTPLEPQEAKVWSSTRGEKFPVDLQLRASYLGKTYQAKVTANGIEFDGNIYDNPSTAGIAVKKKAGAGKAAASTNGWSFWEMQNTQTGRWESINLLRYG